MGTIFICHILYLIFLPLLTPYVIEFIFPHSLPFFTPFLLSSFLFLLIKYPKWEGPSIDPIKYPHVYPEGIPYSSTDFAWKKFSQGSKIIKSQMYSEQSIRNGLATKICWGTFAVLIVIALLKLSFKSNAKRKNSYIFKAWQMIASVSSFIAIIVCANIAWHIKKGDGYPDDKSYQYNQPQESAEQFRYAHDYDAYTLKIVGKISTAGHFFRIPKIYDLSKVYGSTIQITLIAFMESYAVARKIAANVNQLHILDANQEMWANGAANLVGCVSSAFPVSGSFSRSSLNYASGARTPLSKVTTMIIIIIAVTSLTKTFEFIPNAGLAAVIFVAISNLFGFYDFWHAFKHSKKDFFTMLATCVLVIVFDTSVGLLCGLGISGIVYIYDISVSSATAPIREKFAAKNNGVDVVLLTGDLTFFTAYRLKEFISTMTYTLPASVAVTATLGEKVFATVSQKLDNVLLDEKVVVDELPNEIVIKMDGVRIIDLTGLEALAEVVKECKTKSIKVSFQNIQKSIEHSVKEYGIVPSGVAATTSAESEATSSSSSQASAEGQIELSSLDSSTGKSSPKYTLVSSNEVV